MDGTSTSPKKNFSQIASIVEKSNVFPQEAMLQLAMDKKKTVASPTFVQETIAELKKVTWPTRGETIRLTAVVIVISLIIGLYLGIIDILLTKLLEVLTQVR